jgi:hypothetical protein
MKTREFDLILSFPSSFSLSNEQRREIINEFKAKRNAAKAYKHTYERCYQQIEVKKSPLKVFFEKKILYSF